MKSLFQHLPPSMFGYKDIGLGRRGGSGRLAIGSFLLIPMPIGFLVTGGAIQVAGLGFPDIGDNDDVNP